MNDLKKSEHSIKPHDLKRLCFVRYRCAGNGPWNYFYERPPVGTTHVGYVGLYLGEDEKFYLSASDFAIFSDGTMQPVHIKHWPKNGTIEIQIVDMPAQS